MSKNSEGVKAWRKRTKQRIIDAMGGKCCICGYNKCNEALSLHHRDPKQKELSFGSIRANNISWHKIATELRKCILVCENCHREIHFNVVDIPLDAPIFDEKFFDYQKLVEKEITFCPICGDRKPINQITCSLKCSGIRAFKVDWIKYNIIELVKTMNNVEIGEFVGCTESAVRKRRKKLGI